MTALVFQDWQEGVHVLGCNSVVRTGWRDSFVG